MLSMHKLFLSPKAEDDLEEIFTYTYLNWGLRKAENYQDQLFESMENLLSNPKVGSIYYHKRGNYRKLNSNRHVIFYRIENQDCIVMRILHERMDLKRLID